MLEQRNRILTMAKDPAINWYFDNWSGGTKGFSRHQKGCYMDLLESQFYLGPLSLEQIKNILGSDFNQWEKLKPKFETDGNGNFFNERLELEKNKRKRYSESRSSNRKKKDMKNISVSNDLDMLNTPEIETETVLLKEGTGENFKQQTTPPPVTEVPVWTIEHCLEVSLRDQRWVSANKTNREELQTFNKMLEAEGTYQKTAIDYKAHFSRWKRKVGITPENNNTQQSGTYQPRMVI